MEGEIISFAVASLYSLCQPPEIQQQFSRQDRKNIIRGIWLIFQDSSLHHPVNKK